jgi:hypothetical protein
MICYLLVIIGIKFIKGVELLGFMAIDQGVRERIAREFAVQPDLVRVLEAFEMQRRGDPVEHDDIGLYTSLNGIPDQDILQVMRQNGTGSSLILAGVEQYGMVLVVASLSQYEYNRGNWHYPPVDVDKKYLLPQVKLFVLPDFSGPIEFEDAWVEHDTDEIYISLLYGGLVEGSLVHYSSTIESPVTYSGARQDILKKNFRVCLPNLDQQGNLVDDAQTGVEHYLIHTEGRTEDVPAAYNVSPEELVRLNRHMLDVMLTAGRNFAQLMSSRQKHVINQEARGTLYLCGAGIDSNMGALNYAATAYVASLSPQPGTE